MNDTQKKYAEKRIRAIAEAKTSKIRNWNYLTEKDQEAIRKKVLQKYTPKLVSATTLIARVKACIVTDRGSIDLRNIVTNCKAIRIYVDQLWEEIKQERIDKRNSILQKANKLCDELVLGDAKEILAKIREFEKE